MKPPASSSLRSLSRWLMATAHAQTERLVASPQMSAGVRTHWPLAAEIKFHCEFVSSAPRLVGKTADRDTSRPIPGATVTVRKADGDRRTPEIGSDGFWSVEALSPGGVYATISASG